MHAIAEFFKELNPTVTSAVVAALVALLVGLWAPFKNGKISLLVAQHKAEIDTVLAENANSWAEYELRREAYLEVATQIESIFADSGGVGVDVYLRTVRKLWLIAPDPVVQAANGLSRSIRDNDSQENRQIAYQRLFNEMRRDIRQRHLQPPVGTDLGLDAFPLDSAKRSSDYRQRI